MTGDAPEDAQADERADIAAARRVVVKVGSSSLTTADGGIDEGRVAALAGVLADQVRAGTQVVLVSSGAIAAGLAPLRLARLPRDLATQQAAASVGQGLLVAPPADACCDPNRSAAAVRRGGHNGDRPAKQLDRSASLRSE